MLEYLSLPKGSDFLSKRYLWVLVVYIINYFSGIVGIPIVRTLLVKFTSLSASETVNNSIVIWNIVANVLTLLVIWLLLRKEPARDRVLRGEKTTLPQSIIWAFAGVVLLFIGQSFASIITQLFVDTSSGSENTQILTGLTKQAPILIVFITLIAPIIEEIVFRRVLFGGLSNWVNIHVSAVISSLLFALGHSDLPFLLVYFLVGLILCFLYTKTKRIAVPIFAHMMMNAIVLIISLGGVF